MISHSLIIDHSSIPCKNCQVMGCGKEKDYIYNWEGMKHGLDRME